MRWARAEIDLSAVRHNVRVLRATVDPVPVWAVVKADAYGHGAVSVARAAIDAGVDGLCVALVQEGIELREAGVDVPILVLSEQPVETAAAMAAAHLTPTCYHPEFIDGFADAVAAEGAARRPVHLKVDTGMRRVGAEPVDVDRLVRRVDAWAPTIELGGIFTHLACADDPDAPSNVEQLDRLDEVITTCPALAGRSSGLVVHAANSAAAIAIPRARRSLVRCGIALYGISPGPGLVGDAARVIEELRPVMRLVARVSHVKQVDVGESVSYGWRYRTDRPTTLATVPVGYADGVPRRLGAVAGRPGASVLVGGIRCPVVGVVTMDQFVVDVGEAAAHDLVRVGDEVVLIGSQGDETVTVEEWARLADTIGYEIVCGISGRVPRSQIHAADGP